MPFEYNAIESQQGDVLSYLKKLDVHAEGIREYRTSLIPKSLVGFRIATQLDPLDTIISHALIYEISDDIERARVPKGNEIVFSFRLKPEKDGTMYDPDYTYTTFINKAISLVGFNNYSHVLQTDIADFYPSIYLHNIETALGEAVKASGKAAHAQVLINYLKAMHLNQTHKGLPVGPQFSRPLAELILNDVDRILIEKGLVFVRYVDDYIIFANSAADAYAKLSFLAQVLYDTRNLKLNEKKTEILAKDVFIKKHSTTPAKVEAENIVNRFNDLLGELGIDQNPYEDIDPDSISEEDWERLRSINLKQILEAELSKAEPDGSLVTFTLSNLARIDNTEVADIILTDTSVAKLFPRLRSIVAYLTRVRAFSNDHQYQIGQKVIDLLGNTLLSALEFNRMWLLHMFTLSSEWDHAEYFESLYERYNDNLTLRELLLAIGRARNISFYRKNKGMSLDMSDWTRRAFLAGVSCLPEDERNPWYKARSLRNRDFLDRIVEVWALKNHF